MERKNTTEFNCQWCPETKRCSDLADRHRAEWELANCALDPIKEISDARCLHGKTASSTTTTTTTTTTAAASSSTTTTATTTATTTTATTATTTGAITATTTTATTTTATTTTATLYHFNAEQQKGRSKGGVPAGTIVVICIVLILVVGIAAWCVYAYRHPTSKSGLFLIDATRRPRELFKRSSGGGGKIGAVTLSDVKPQVL